MGASPMMMSRGNRSPSVARFVVTSLLAVTAVIAVFVVTQDAETAREAAPSPAFRGAPNVQQQLSQQLQRYDMAIKRVDDDIARSKVNLVDESKKLGEATQLAVKLHDKLVRDHQTLLAEAARSRAMKQLRSQLAKKQSVVAAERQKLQSDAMQLAEVEQHARSLLSPKYTPSAQELQAVSQEVNVAPPPPLSLGYTFKTDVDPVVGLSSRWSDASESR